MLSLVLFPERWRRPLFLSSHDQAELLCQITAIMSLSLDTYRFACLWRTDAAPSGIAGRTPGC